MVMGKVNYNVICKLKLDSIYEKRPDKSIKALEGSMSMSIKNGMTCPVCGQGRIYKEFKQEEFEYKGQKLTLENYPVLECDACGEEFVAAEDAKTFDKQMTNFHREVDGLLKPDEIRGIRESLGYNQTEFARLLKVGVKNFARYETGISPQSRYLDWLLRILKEYPETIRVIDGGHHKAKSYRSASETSRQKIRVH
jgi:HTH-type transcriptional regulator/antitoxin MqsA